MSKYIPWRQARVTADGRQDSGRPVRTATKNDNRLYERPCVASLTAGLQRRPLLTSVFMLTL